MVTSLFGILTLIGVVLTALSENTNKDISFFDIHAAIIVVGGVLGSLLIALKKESLFNMFFSIKDILHYKNSFQSSIKDSKETFLKIKSYWRSSQRAKVLEISEKTNLTDIKLVTNSLLNRQNNLQIEEEFTTLKSGYLDYYLPIIEGWELVAKLAPSFGMVGTVTGMVMLFKNMSGDTGNLGGSMAMALLATLYGITFGAALGGPMVSRINNQLNEKMAHAELMYKTILGLLSEDKLKQKES